MPRSDGRFLSRSLLSEQCSLHFTSLPRRGMITKAAVSAVGCAHGVHTGYGISRQRHCCRALSVFSSLVAGGGLISAAVRQGHGGSGTLRRGLLAFEPASLTWDHLIDGSAQRLIRDFIR